ncbi:MAG: stage II sporulation protein M [Methanobacteriota archaeon]
MIRNSIKIFLIGFVSGAAASAIFVLLFPSIYYAFLALLGRKIEAQAGAVGSLSLAIILNNLIASFLCSYGGFIATKAFLILKSGPSTFLIKLSFFDKRVEAISPEKLKYYLSLYIFPAFILFLNGFVLGAFFIFYIQNLEKYYGGLFLHGYFELSAIILSGSIGLEIADRAISSVEDLEKFRRELNVLARGKILKYFLVVALLIVGGILEVL